MLNLFFALIFFFATDASAAGIYLIGPNGASPARETPYKLEFRGYSRSSDQEEWKQTDTGVLCFTAEKSDTGPCYKSVGARISIIEVPKDPELNPIISTDYQYAIEFSEPTEGRSKVTTIQQVFTKSEKEDAWRAVYPNLLSAANDIQLGAWSTIEYQHDRNSFRRLEVRLVSTR